MKKKILILLLSITGLFTACTDDYVADSSYWKQPESRNDTPLMREAKTMVEDTRGALALPDMATTFNKAGTRATGNTTQTLNSGDFSLEWNKAQNIQEENADVLIIPVKMQYTTSVRRHTVIGNKKKAEMTPMYSMLFLKKFKRTGYTMSYILSYAPDRQYMQEKKNNMDGLKHDPRNTDYTGLYLVSTLEGIFLHGIQFEKGREQFRFKPNLPKPLQHNCGGQQCTHHDSVIPNRIPEVSQIQATARINIEFVTSKGITRSACYSNDNEEQIPPCAICYGDPYTCDCLTVLGCQYCYNTPCVCDICETCSKRKPECECPSKCPWCGQEICTCEAQIGGNDGNGDGETGGGSFGGGGGGPSGGGSGGSGGGSGGHTSSQTTPCSSSATGKSNPLVAMRLAPPSSSNIPGALFGYTRDSGTRFHNGIDLHAPVGTPIYAMADGVVAKLLVTTQPNKVGKEFPANYSGDRNNAGNRMYIQSTINGQTVYFAFFHLQAGNPVGKNSNGQPLRLGDRVSAGDIIGYTGITGNANANVPHLHISVQNSAGNWIDPSPYLNATIQSNTIIITTPCDQ